MPPEVSTLGNRKRVTHRGKQSMKKKKLKTEKFKKRLVKLQDAALKICKVCHTDPFSTVGINFQTYTSCSDCGQSLDDTEYPRCIFIDIERTGGPKDAPLTIGLAVYKGPVLEQRKHIFILPDGEDPKASSVCSRKIHCMSVGYIKGKKVLLFKKKSIKKVLPAVSSREAAEDLLQFLRSVGRHNMFHHGMDHVTMRDFMQSLGLYSEFRELIYKMVNTQEFFVVVQQGRRFGMKTIVNDWGTEEDKKNYENAHSAEVDAVVLGSLCTGTLLKRFIDWQYLCSEASSQVIYLDSSQLSAHYIEQNVSMKQDISKFYFEV